MGKFRSVLTYLEHHLNGKYLRFHLTDSAKPKLTEVLMNELTVPVYSHAEEHHIAVEVGGHLSIVDELQNGVAANLQGTVRICQSIIHRVSDVGVKLNNL